MYGLLAKALFWGMDIIYGRKRTLSKFKVLEVIARVPYQSWEQVAYIARRLDSIQEGERTALDNSMLMLCSSMLHGNHDATQLPVVLLGSGGGQIKGGQNLDYLESPDRQMCRLYLSMMNKMGLKLDRFGDATSPLPEI